MRPKYFRMLSAALLALASGSVVATEAGDTRLSYEQLYRLAKRADLTGKAQTVLGAVSPETLGFTLMHEHLFVDFFPDFDWPRDPEHMPAGVFRKLQETGRTIPVDAAEREFFARPDITLSMVNDLRRGLSSRANLVIDRENEVADEVERYRQVGGRTIVDVTSHGLGRDAQRLRRFAQRHELSVVMGTGWYRWPSQTLLAREQSVDALAEQIVLDIVRGDATGNVKAGIIGEIGLDSRSQILEGVPQISNEEIRLRSGAVERRLEALSVEDRDRVPLRDVYDPREIKMLRAAARASRLSGAAVMLHAREPWLGYLDVLREEGVPTSRIIVGHAHPHFMERELLVRAMRSGVVLEADYMLQQYATRAPLGPFDAILDGVAWAIRNGYRDQVLLSLDLCNRLGQQRYGGGGYTTLHDYVFPYLRRRGVTDEDIHHVMIDNPKRLLTFVAPQPLRPAPPVSP